MDRIKLKKEEYSIVTIGIFTLILFFSFLIFTFPTVIQNPQYLIRPFSQITRGVLSRIGNFFTHPDMAVQEIVQPHDMSNMTIKYQDAFPGSNQSLLFTQETIEMDNPYHQMHVFPSFPRTELVLKNIFNDLSPLAKFQLQFIPAKQLLEQDPNLPPPHLTHDPSFSDRQSKILVTRQLVIEKALDQSGGLNTNQFYADLEKTAETNPWVFQHIKHYQQMDDPYMHLDPRIRARELYSHLGAVFGYNLLHTPLAAHYKGVLKDPPTGNYNQEYLYSIDPENVFKFNNNQGAYQSVNMALPNLWPQMYPFNANAQQVQGFIDSLTPEDAKKYNFKQPFHKLGLSLDKKMPEYIRKRN